MAKKEKKEKKAKRNKGAAEDAESSEGKKSLGKKIRGILLRILLLLVVIGAVAVGGYIGGNKLIGAMKMPDPTVIILPVTYTVGEETIPALSIPVGTELRYKAEMVVPEGEEESEEESEDAETKDEAPAETPADEAPQESPELDENGEPIVSEPPLPMDTWIYTYGKITGTDTLSADYVKLLYEEYNLLPVDEELNELEELPELPLETGSVHLVKEPVGVEWLFSVEVSWDPESCTVKVGPMEGAIEYLPVEGMSAFEALDYMAAMDPAVLGLPVGPDTNYKYYLINGVVMAEGKPCIHINVYGEAPDTGTNQLMGSYLIASDKSRLYHLDEVNKTITELPLPK